MEHETHSHKQKRETVSYAGGAGYATLCRALPLIISMSRLITPRGSLQDEAQFESWSMWRNSNRTKRAHGAERGAREESTASSARQQRRGSR